MSVATLKAQAAPSMRAVALPTNLMPDDDLLRVLTKHRARFVDIAGTIVGCRLRAEDVVQEAAVRLCQQSRVTAAVDPDRFLNRMVRNLAIDVLRQAKRERRVITTQDEAEQAAPPCDCPLRSLCARQELRGVLRALEAAPLRTRQAFVAHRVEGLPQRDVAARLGVSATLVNFMIRDATALCRQAAQI